MSLQASASLPPPHAEENTSHTTFAARTAVLQGVTRKQPRFGQVSWQKNHMRTARTHRMHILICIRWATMLVAAVKAMSNYPQGWASVHDRSGCDSLRPPSAFFQRHGRADRRNVPAADAL